MVKEEVFPINMEEVEEIDLETAIVRGEIVSLSTFIRSIEVSKPVSHI